MTLHLVFDIFLIVIAILILPIGILYIKFFVKAKITYDLPQEDIVNQYNKYSELFLKVKKNR